MLTIKPVGVLIIFNAVMPSLFLPATTRAKGKAKGLASWYYNPHQINN
jgi:hypothetical protein